MNMQHLTLACLETTCLSPTWCFCCKKKCFQCKILRITKYIKYIQSTIIKSTVFSLSISVLCSVLQNSIYMFIFSSYFSTEQFSCSFLSFGLKNMDSNIRPCFVSFYLNPANPQKPKHFWFQVLMYSIIIVLAGLLVTLHAWHAWKKSRCNPSSHC